MECRHPNKYIIHIIKNPKKLIQSNSEFLVSKFLNVLFPLKMKQTTNYRIFLCKKIKRKHDPQPKNEPLPNSHLAIPSQRIKLKMT